MGTVGTVGTVGTGLFLGALDFQNRTKIGDFCQPPIGRHVPNHPTLGGRFPKCNEKRPPRHCPPHTNTKKSRAGRAATGRPKPTRPRPNWPLQRGFQNPLGVATTARPARAPPMGFSGPPWNRHTPDHSPKHAPDGRGLELFFQKIHNLGIRGVVTTTPIPNTIAHPDWAPPTGFSEPPWNRHTLDPTPCWPRPPKTPTRAATDLNFFQKIQKLSTHPVIYFSLNHIALEVVIIHLLLNHSFSLICFFL